MKYKVILLLFLFSKCMICEAKDSTIVFKLALGISYNKISIPEYHNNKSPYGFGIYNESLTIRKKSDFSPLLKLDFEKKLNSFLGIKLACSYNFVNYNYLYYKSLSHWVGPSSNLVFVHDSTISRNYFINNHNFFLGIGPSINYKKLYIIPKVNIIYAYCRSKNEEVYITSETKKSTLKNTTKNLIYGAGLALGYNFKIKKTSLFFEIESSYYKSTKLLYQKNLYCSFVFGFVLQ